MNFTDIAQVRRESNQLANEKTMAIGKAGAKNAAILSAQILGAKSSDTREKVAAYKKEIAEQVVENNQR
jgi:phosphoribosylcarboxyaminoimidazole (NCAIR) mutase